jgi:transcriptional regulator with GAF, ATPase, and Fis domain
MSAIPLYPLPPGGVLVATACAKWREQNIQELQLSHHPIAGAVGGADALSKLEQGDWRTLLLDRRLPDLEVEELVAIVGRKFPRVEILFLDSQTGRPSAESGSNVPAVIQIAETKERQPHRDAPSHPPVAPLPGIIGSSAPMLRLYRMARLVAPRTTTVLITGPTGTGKELFARAIHQLSPRAARPFSVVNCAAIPEALLESELFGYVRGAFTGAVQSQVGRAQAAQGGTLFLDEIGEMPLSLQSKLLRFLEQKEIQRLGSPEVLRVDVRVLAATNTELGPKVARREFREDLFYRLSAFCLDLPPLALRKGDLLPLARHFLAAVSGNSPVPALSEDAVRVLEKHSWPGNVRELQLVLERASILAESSREILAEHIAFPSLPEGTKGGEPLQLAV